MRRGRWIVLLFLMLLTASVSSEVWAAANQRALRQTVPTRTPTKAPDTPSPTAASATSTPSPEPPTPTTETDKSRGASSPTEAPSIAATNEAQSSATVQAITEAGYPTTGGEHVPLLISASLLCLLVALTAIVWISRRLRADP